MTSISRLASHLRVWTGREISTPPPCPSCWRWAVAGGHECRVRSFWCLSFVSNFFLFVWVRDFAIDFVLLALTSSEGLPVFGLIVLFSRLDLLLEPTASPGHLYCGFFFVHTLPFIWFFFFLIDFPGLDQPENLFRLLRRRSPPFSNPDTFSIRDSWIFLILTLLFRGLLPNLDVLPLFPFHLLAGIPCESFFVPFFSFLAPFFNIPLFHFYIFLEEGLAFFHGHEAFFTARHGG